MRYGADRQINTFVYAMKQAKTMLPFSFWHIWNSDGWFNRNVGAALQLTRANLPHCQRPLCSVLAIIVTAPLFYYSLS